MNYFFLEKKIGVVIKYCVLIFFMLLVTSKSEGQEKDYLIIKDALVNRNIDILSSYAPDSGSGLVQFKTPNRDLIEVDRESLSKQLSDYFKEDTTSYFYEQLYNDSISSESP